MSNRPIGNLPALNTDVTLWRKDGNSIFVTEGGAIGINVGGSVVVLPIEKWHELAWTPQWKPAPPPVCDLCRWCCSDLCLLCGCCKHGSRHTERTWSGFHEFVTSSLASKPNADKPSPSSEISAPKPPSAELGAEPQPVVNRSSTSGVSAPALSEERIVLRWIIGTCLLGRGDAMTSCRYYKAATEEEKSAINRIMEEK